MCDGRHGTVYADGRHSRCQQGSGESKHIPFEPGDTKQPWKGEAAARFVSAGITSSCALPTSSAGYWSPIFHLDRASASGAKCSSGGVFSLALAPSHRLENTNSLPSGSLNLAMVPQISFFGSSASSTPFDLSSFAVANTSSHQNVMG